MSDYNSIIVGGGIAGLISANYLVSFGKKVLVLEQSHHAGGNMSGFHRNGFYFDGGDQSFESLGIVFPLLKELGLFDEKDWAKARYRMISPDFDFFIDSFDGIEDALREAFPKEKGISLLFREVREVSRFIEANCDPWSFPLFDDFSYARLLGMARHLPKLRKWLTYDYREKVCSVIEDPGLRTWFSQIGYYRMPFIFFAGFWHLWMKDYWYPRGGMQAFLDKLAARFTGLGGKIKYRTRAVHIEHKGGKAVSVATDKGESFSADSFIYAADYKKLLESVLDPSLFKSSFREKILGAKLTEQILTVFLGLDKNPAELAKKLEAQHLFYFPNYDVIFPDKNSPRDVHKNMWVALNHFGLENPGGAPEGKTTLVLQTYSSYDWQDHWKNSSGAYPRTAAYRDFKMEVAGELVGLAENVIPGLHKMISCMDVGTPLSIERFSLNTRGSTGGWCYDDKESPAFRLPSLNLIKTPLSNLRTAGHYSLWPGGVISAALSGKIVANLTAKRKPFAALNQG